LSGYLLMSRLKELLEGMYRRITFNGVAVSEELVNDILAILRYMPSQANLQPWEVVVVDDEGIKGRVVESTLDPLLRDEEELKPLWLKNSPLILVVCADTDRVSRRFGVIGREFALEDAYAAALIIALHAIELGYLAAVVREFNPVKLREVLNIPKWVEPVAIIAIGKALDEGKVIKPSLDVSDFTHHNLWGM